MGYIKHKSKNKNSERDIVAVCIIREEYERNCRDCIYYNNGCETMKEKYNINKPTEMRFMLE